MGLIDKLKEQALSKANELLGPQQIEDQQNYQAQQAPPMPQQAPSMPQQASPMPQQASPMPQQNQSTKYGNVQKCPQCGMPVEPMAVKCSTCGYEFRNVQALNSAQQLAAKLEAIDLAYRAKKKLRDNDIIQKGYEYGRVIRSFPVPTTKEDLLDFCITMKSRCWDPGADDEQAAYYDKYEECITKAKILFPDDPHFQPLIAQYQEDKEKEANKKGCSLFILLAIVSTSALWVIL